MRTSAMPANPPEHQLNEAEHQVFLHAFDEPTRRALIEEDASAWKAVCSLLFAIVSLGLLIGLFALFLVM